MNWLQYKPDVFQYKDKWISNWFSNMTPCTIEIDGITYPSVENYYQAMKSTNVIVHQQVACMTPQGAKQFGKRIHSRPDWSNVKLSFMQIGLYKKFRQPEWKKKLLATGNEPIIEWNNWKDRYWGVTEDGIGNNHLGMMLMRIRTLLKH